MGKTVGASMFALRLAASINLRMHLQLKNFKREQGGERRKGGGGGKWQREVQPALLPGKMKSSPLARTAIVVSNCLGYFALTIDRNYAL